MIHYIFFYQGRFSLYYLRAFCVPLVVRVPQIEKRCNGDLGRHSFKDFGARLQRYKVKYQNDDVYYLYIVLLQVF